MGNSAQIRLPSTDRAFNRLSTTDRPGLVIVQHLLPDTLEFLRLLRSHGFEIRAVLGIGYSSHPSVAEQAAKHAGHLEVLDVPDIGPAIRRHCANGDGPVVLLEVGGYGASLAAEPDAGLLGVVEETKNGLWSYRAQAALAVPVFQIADSRLKRVECSFVADAVVRVVQRELGDAGTNLTGLDVSVLAYGDIGSEVAARFRDAGAVVSCYDPDPVRVLRAATQGIACPERADVISNADLIVGASGCCSVTVEDLDALRDEVVLASASSKDHEFPLGALAERAVARRRVTEQLDEYRMPSGKVIRVMNRGFPVNFATASLPPSIADLMFCQIAACLNLLLRGERQPGIHCLSRSEEDGVARLWLDSHAR